MGSGTRVLFVLSIALCVVVCAFAGRNIPKDSKIADKKQPQWLTYDGTVLVPGLGRYVVPKRGTIVNPFTYNPITGTNGGNGFPTFGFGGPTAGGVGGTNIPGGDDTFVPNPVVEVPTPIGGSIPTPSKH